MSPRISIYAIRQPGESRICLSRVRWERGIVGDGKGYSNKLSVSICWMPKDCLVGVCSVKISHAKLFYIFLLPWLPIRIKHVRSYGGIFP